MRRQGKSHWQETSCCDQLDQRHSSVHAPALDPRSTGLLITSFRRQPPFSLLLTGACVGAHRVSALESLLSSGKGEYVCFSEI